MRSRSRAIAIAGIVVLIGSLFSSTAASAATVYEVTVGRFIDYPKAESTRMFPSTLRVHRGDVLHFTSGVMHSLAILTAGEDPDDWLKRNWDDPAARERLAAAAAAAAAGPFAWDALAEPTLALYRQVVDA